MSAAELAQELKAADDKRSVAKAHSAKLDVLRRKRRDVRLSSASNTAAAERTKKDVAQAQQETNEKQATAAAEPQGPLAQYASFVSERAALYDKLAAIVAAFEYGSSLVDTDLHTASMDVVLRSCDDWLNNRFGVKTAETVSELAKQGTSLQEQGADICDTSAVQAKYDSAVSLYKAGSGRWHREAKRRRSRESMLAEFETDRTKLLVWCRQQVSMLANLAEPNQVQEFCASFYNNTAVMESNFLVLMEASEDLLPSADVEAKLMELAEVWLGLETQAYEKLRATLLDLHAKSGLEAQARQWPDFADRLNKFLSESERVLSIPTDEESMTVAAPLKSACKDLISNADAHRLIVAHLSDFSIREECIKEHYNAIYKAAFSKLTLMTQAFPGLYSYPRKAEYTDRMAELVDWVEAKSRGQAWKDLLARVDRMKRLIEDNELALSNAEDQS